MASGNAHLGLCNGVRNLFDKPEFSDFKIICNARTFNVHKSIISCQGGFFKRIFSKGFKEAETGTADLSNDDPYIVEATLQFLYSVPFKVPEGYGAPVFYATLYGAADYYQLPYLKHEALQHFHTLAADSTVETARHLFTAANTIYKTTPEEDRGLRDQIVPVIHRHIKAVIHEDQGNQLILKELPQLCYDLVRMLASPPVSKHPSVDLRFLCLKCNQVFGLVNRTNNQRTNWAAGVFSTTCVSCRQKAQVGSFEDAYENKFGKFDGS